MKRSHAIVLVVALCCGCASILNMEQGGFNVISLDQEWAMRDDLMRQVQKEYRLIDDPTALSYVNEVGRRLVAQTDLRDRRWDFGIVDDASVNAFNLPGGLVYVNRGLVAEAASLDQFTAVMGHEIAHGVARHGTQLMTRSLGLDAIMGIVLGQDVSQTEQVLGSVVGGGILAKYGREAEREADRLGIRYMHAAGYDPRGAAAMFRKLLALRQGQPSKVEGFFSSHPLTEERIQSAEQQAAELSRTSSLVHDTPAYQDFRRRLR
jgi:predicted Zn-dependent protease